ncbi:hypothetical protein ACOMHN_023319 [Nucella lapillus]
MLMTVLWREGQHREPQATGYERKHRPSTERQPRGKPARKSVKNMEVQSQRECRPQADLHHHGHHQFLQHVAHRSGNVGLKPREWELAKGPGN